MSDVTQAVQRAVDAVLFKPHIGNTQDIVETALGAALDAEEMARALHADDLTQGFASMDYDDMDPVAVEWYRSGARAVRAAILGGDS